MEETGIETLQRFSKKKTEDTKEEKTEKKELNTLDKYIIFCFSFITIFTFATLVIFACNGSEPTTLIISVFGCISGEILLCFLIKRFKLHEEAKLVFKKKQNSYDEGGEI